MKFSIKGFIPVAMCAVLIAAAPVKSTVNAASVDLDGIANGINSQIVVGIGNLGESCDILSQLQCFPSFQICSGTNIPNIPEINIPSMPDVPDVPGTETPDMPEAGAPDASVANFEQQVFDLVNEERAKHGLSSLVWSDELATVARAHSKDMNDRQFFSHQNPDGLSPFDRIKNSGISYSRAAENIAAGQTTPQQVMDGWMNSDGHRANILDPNLTMLGVGYYEGDGPYRTYWTQNFIAESF